MAVLLHRHGIFLIEMKADHIAFVFLVIFQIAYELPFPAVMVFFSAPDFQFNDVLLSLAIYDYIGTAKPSGAGFYIIITASV